MIRQLDLLLRRGHFPKELPPTFHTRDFAQYVEDTGPLTLASTPGQKILISRPANHNLARPGRLRRKIQIWNPFNYYELCFTIVNGWSTIKSHLGKSSISASGPVEDDSQRRALVPENGGNELPGLRARNRAVARHLLKTDVSRFYHSIYTHSIPWALDGKAAAKGQRSGGIGNELDRALRNGQDGQTLGIPVGPDASLVLAEIIASAVDQELSDLAGQGFRFIDDYEFGFSTHSRAETALARIEKALGHFELAINPLKTAIAPLPQPLDHDWVTSIRQYTFKEDEPVSAKELLRFFNHAFALRRDQPMEPVIAYAVGRLRAASVEEDDWELYQDLLFQCAIAEPASIPIVLGQLHRHRQYGLSDKLTEVLEEIITAHSPLGHSSEIAWAVWTAICFEVSLGETAVKALATIDDPVVILLVLHAREEGRLEGNVDLSHWSQWLAGSELYDRNWLVAYEASRRGWLKAPGGKDEVSNDPNFEPLSRSAVSFYETDPESPVAYLEDITGYGDFYDATHETDTNVEF